MGVRAGGAFLACEMPAEEPPVDLRLSAPVTVAAVSGGILVVFLTFTASTFRLVLLLQRRLD